MVHSVHCFLNILWLFHTFWDFAHTLPLTKNASPSLPWHTIIPMTWLVWTSFSSHRIGYSFLRVPIALQVEDLWLLFIEFHLSSFFFFFLNPPPSHRIESGGTVPAAQPGCQSKALTLVLYPYFTFTGDYADVQLSHVPSWTPQPQAFGHGSDLWKVLKKHSM